jgi:hypothetical protein
VKSEGEFERVDRRIDSPFSRPAIFILLVLALTKILLHTLTNGQYGFHRDELATLDDARHLAWGYVAYPPVTPFIGRIALQLFGTSLTGFRFFAAVAQGCVLVLAGLIAGELGGSRRAQVLAAVAVAIAPVSLSAGRLFQYVSFDYLWWVLLGYLMIRLLSTDNAQVWIAIGLTIGLGMLTKYTMIFLVAGIVAGVLLTDARRHLKSPWLWCGVVLSLLVVLPNFLWEVRHDLISVDFLRSIHARDVQIGRTDGFIVKQGLVGSAIVPIPMAIAGLYFFFFARDGKRFRALGFMFVVPLVLFVLVRGRDYYQAPAYPMLLSAGAVWIDHRGMLNRRMSRGIVWALLAANAAFNVAVLLPLAPVNSAWWQTVAKLNGDVKEEIGWPELVQSVAAVRDSLPASDLDHLGILAGNYGEAGAINLYGPDYKLPAAISGINSYWLRGYGNPPPQTLIVMGLSRKRLEENFESCKLAAHITNRFGVMNEESTYHPDIFVCRGLRSSWERFWERLKSYG